MTRRLGKGINALFPEEATKTDEHEGIQEISLKDLRPNPYQPRKTFDEESIQELKSSIEVHGVIQPLIVRKGIKGYDIVAGERRYRAAIEAKLTTVPAVVKTFTDQEMMEIALIENLQRENLNPIEEALAFRKLMEELGLTQEELSKKVGKSRPYIANQIRLLQLDRAVQSLIAEGKLSMGHGRALLGIKNKNKLPIVVDKVIKEQMNVRDLEKLIQKINQNVSRETSRKKEIKLSPILREKETMLKQRFGTSVSIRQSSKKGKGKIEIEYFSDDDLNRILDILG
ncbi:ParB/RepB/Spo0J family partition protein [Camelliibacillus cellulosilyticus]|uniref:ParB/RepB/Spo0J family partition protein n=1 Tax=Camelliibacillus cellulosilyticus TaxID=2174486 RepID=A0ABV9GQW8_9BACL